MSLDHDYCSIFNRNTFNKSKKTSYLTEKNPKRDSGMESGDVSDTSEGTNTPDATLNKTVVSSIKKYSCNEFFLIFDRHYKMYLFSFFFCSSLLRALD